MSDRVEIEPMPVTRIEYEQGSHIEPTIEPDWPAKKQIAWRFGCLVADTGYTDLKLSFFPTNWAISAPGISISGGTGSPRHDLKEIWHALNWIEFGIKAERSRRNAL